MGKFTPYEIEAVKGSAWDAVVVGAGPAGSLAARELARRGARVLLVEKTVFPRYKVCGCCLSDRALNVLASVGLGRLAEESGAVQLERFELAAEGRKACVPLPGGSALSRAVFDTALAEAAQSVGVRFISGCRAVLTGGTREGWTLELRSCASRAEVRARVVLAADGLGQRLLRNTESFESRVVKSAHIGAGAILDEAPSFYRHGSIYMAVTEAGYLGLVRVERDQLNIAAALNPKAVRDHGGLGATVKVILEKAGYSVIPSLSEAHWRGTPRLTRCASRLSSHRFLVLGDAAGYVEPFTGEGMTCALSTGRAAACLVHESLDNFSQETELAWAKRYRQLTWSSQWRCRAIAVGLRRPLLVGMATRALGWMPGLVSPIMRQLNAIPRVEKEMHS